MIEARRSSPEESGLLTLAVLAVGGQGGGVLSKLIVELAETNGYRAQSTYVPGVAQRTGATLYYIEMAPEQVNPIFSLMPVVGRVDIVIAAELMEAGRAVQRGLVTKDRTTLIASDHRILTIGEKSVPGDGIHVSDEVQSAMFTQARRAIVYDMQQLAKETGSHISTVMFGALSAAQALPFDKSAFERVMQSNARSGADMEAFEAAHSPPAVKPETVQSRKTAAPVFARLQSRLEALPDAVREMATAGLRKVVDYQDIAYGDEYLEAVEDAVRKDPETEFSTAFAKHLANAMCYMDILRVADLKTRRARFERIRDDYTEGSDPIYRITEFLHPRGEEFISILPAGIGGRLERSAKARHLIDRVLNKGRRVKSNRLGGFLLLYTISGACRWRRSLLRHRQESVWIAGWRELCFELIGEDYALAVEAVRAQRLIKGYGDTHARGNGHYAKIISGLALVRGRDDAAEWFGRFVKAALSDSTGKALDGAIQTVQTFSDDHAGAAQER